MSQNPFADPYQTPQPLPTGYSPLPSGEKPAVWFWYIGYCLAMALLYLGCASMGFLLPFIDEASPSETIVMAVVFIGMCLPLFCLYAAAPFLPRRKFAWYYGFVTIGIGFTSCCTLPFSIALLIQWLKPEVKAYLNAL
jgi:hypothetical protein